MQARTLKYGMDLGAVIATDLLVLVSLPLLLDNSRCGMPA
jgi:hypothetical protein